MGRRLYTFHSSSTAGRGMVSIINFNVGVLGHVDSGKTSLGARPVQQHQRCERMRAAGERMRCKALSPRVDRRGDYTHAACLPAKHRTSSVC